MIHVVCRKKILKIRIRKSKKEKHHIGKKEKGKKKNNKPQNITQKTEDRARLNLILTIPIQGRFFLESEINLMLLTNKNRIN